MRKLPAALTLTSLLLLTACSSLTHQEAKQEAAKVMAANTEADIARDAAAAAQVSNLYGDRYIAANLFLKAYEADPTVKNKFNPTNAYASIGKTDAAVAMYTDLVQEGQFVRLTQVFPYSAGPRHVRTFNVADESQRRIGVIMARSGPTSAVATATGVPDTGISDEQARQLDLARENGQNVTPASLALANGQTRTAQLPASSAIR